MVFSYVVKGIKIKITAKFRASRRLSFEDTKRFMSPEMRQKSLGTFEKQAPGSEGIESFVYGLGRRQQFCLSARLSYSASVTVRRQELLLLLCGTQLLKLFGARFLLLALIFSSSLAGWIFCQV